MIVPKVDTYTAWKNKNQLDKKLKQLSELKSKGLTLVDIAKAMKISFQALNNMQQKYSDVQEALDKGLGIELDNLMSAMLKRALGHRVEISETTYIYDEKGNKRPTQCKVKELYFPPDNEAMNRVLEIKHGIHRSKVYEEEKTILEDNYEEEIKKAASGMVIGETNEIIQEE